MSNIFRKNFHLCFSKIRCLPTSHSPPLTLEDDEHEFEFEQKHLSNNNNNNNTAVVINNFNSMYDEPSFSSSSSTTIIDEFSMSCSTSSVTNSPDFSAIFASQRLFVASPGHSNSILESLSAASSSRSRDRVVDGGVPIKKYSPHPYVDFRTSMQEMIDARIRENELKKFTNDNDTDNDDDLLEYLQELLLCYLNLNPKHTHKYIIEAFADLLVSHMST